MFLFFFYYGGRTSVRRRTNTTNNDILDVPKPTENIMTVHSGQGRAGTMRQTENPIACIGVRALHVRVSYRGPETDGARRLRWDGGPVGRHRAHDGKSMEAQRTHGRYKYVLIIKTWHDKTWKKRCYLLIHNNFSKFW